MERRRLFSRLFRADKFIPEFSEVKPPCSLVAVSEGNGTFPAIAPMI
jgi:hypothetical protein